MLKIASDPKKPFFNNGKYLLDVTYAKMDPIRSTIELPATERIKAVGEWI